MPEGLITSSIRPGYPDFFDLPWNKNLVDWQAAGASVELMPIGICRHPVIFVRQAGHLYAIKELPEGLAEQEYHLLRKLEDFNLPAVIPVGHLKIQRNQIMYSILITRFLSDSVPYRLLFVRPDFVHYREHLLDAMVSLLVQLHLSGIFWGDCSLSNTLFRRDAGRLQAYLVDAETSEGHSEISDNLREYELDIMEENVGGALADLAAAGDLSEDFPILDTGDMIRKRYQKLWHQITRTEDIPTDQKYRIRERISSLNELGFSVDEVLMQPVSNGNRLKFSVMVTDRNFHKNTLQNLTQIDAEEQQAQRIINEIQALRASLSQQENRSKPLSTAAEQWLSHTYQPSIKCFREADTLDINDVELYCLMQDHKWYLSEKAQQDVGHQKALDDFMQNVLPDYLAGHCGETPA